MRVFLAVVHPFRFTRMFFRAMAGKPLVKPGSRKERKLNEAYEKMRSKQRVWEDEQESLMDEKYAEGYDEAFGDDPVWEMDYE